MKKVSFGTFWQVYGRQTIELPDEIDSEDEYAIIEYLQDNWDIIPLPISDTYIPGSDELDEESIVVIDREINDR